MSDALSFKTTMNFSYGEPLAVATHVDRVVANNPSPFTYSGTNTYLVGASDLAVVDPGPDDADHCAAILKAAGDRRITHILLTHRHRDHVDGIERLKAATGATTYAFTRDTDAPNPNAASPSGEEFVELGFVPDVEVRHNDLIEGDGFALRAVHTPGHAPDHLCFDVVGSNALISGDHVMAWNTSVIAPPEGNMAAYLKALELLLQHEHEVYLPGHGGRIERPRRTVRAYLLHRQWRERDILDAVRSGHRSISDIAGAIYKGLDPKLMGAASLSVLAHAELLCEKNLVVPLGGPLSLKSTFEPVQEKPSVQ